MITVVRARRCYLNKLINNDCHVRMFGTVPDGCIPEPSIMRVIGMIGRLLLIIMLGNDGDYKFLYNCIVEHRSWQGFLSHNLLASLLSPISRGENVWSV